MDFNSNFNEHYRKSVLTTVNDAGETIDGNCEKSLFLGWSVYHSGTALEASDYWHKILRKGLYRVDASVTFVPAEDGAVTIRILLDGKALPASRVHASVEAGKYYTLTTCVPAFDREQSPSLEPRLELSLESPVGIVTRAMLSTIKLA